MDFQWFYKGKSLKPYCNFIENQWIWRIIFDNITSIENTFQNRILENPSRISYPFSKTLSLPNLTLWEVVSSLQLAQFRTADPEHFCHQTLCFQTHPTEVHHMKMDIWEPGWGGGGVVDCFFGTELFSATFFGTLPEITLFGGPGDYLTNVMGLRREKSPITQRATHCQLTIRSQS